MTTWSLEYSFDVDKKNRVIYVKAFGIWKADVARSYVEDFKTEVKPIIGKPWAKLIDLSAWKTSYPDVVEIIGSHMDWSRNNNVAMSLYVLNNPSTFRQLHLAFSAGRTKEISQVFRTLTEAEQFLKENWLTKKRS